MAVVEDLERHVTYRCKALSAEADGYVRGEAVGAMLLAPGADVGRSTGILLAGTAVNQDGRSSSLTAPNGPSQQVQRLI